MHSVVVGLGKTGASCLRYFSRQGIPAGATDSRSAPPGLADLDKGGVVSNFVGGSMPKAGAEVVAFDSEGKVGKLRVAKATGETSPFGMGMCV